MEKKIKKGDTVILNGRRAVVNKIQGARAKVSPPGESSRWVKLSEVERTDT